MLADLRDARGQTSVEWLGVVALVATLLTFGAAVAQGNAMGLRVTREMARALCIVRGGDCERDREPCVIQAVGEQRRSSVDVVFVHLGHGRSALVERRSDGTFSVTSAGEKAFGLVGRTGVGVHASLGDVHLGLGVGLEAEEVLTHEGGRTWIAGSLPEAQAILHGLSDEDELRPPDVEYGTSDLRSSAGASAGADVSIGENDVAHLDIAGARMAFDRRSGQRFDRRTGRRTIFVRSSREFSASVDGGVLGLSGAGGGETYAVELDPAGRPVDLQVVTTGSFGGSLDLPGAVQPVADRLDVPADAGEQRIYEVTAHLDLTKPDNLAVASDLLGAMTRSGPSLSAAPAASRALRARLEADGTVEARVLASRTTSDELGLSANVDHLSLGFQATATSASSRLLAAASRGLDGGWLSRGDCVAGR